ncbi:MAG: flagellar motor switch protein FliG [Actinomycetota bacterium]|nr:flagellar motor switch protein FliG [Actinomycetota bacterium]
MSAIADIDAPMAPIEGAPAAPLPDAPVSAPRTLTGLEKAVVLLTSLPPERAAEVFRHLHDSEIETLSLAMAEARQIPGMTVKAVFEEFIENSMAHEYVSEGGVGFAREVLESAVGFERAEEIFGRLSAILEMRPFEFLRRTPPEQIYAALQNEAPQTIALTIANLHTTLAAKVLAQLPPDDQAEVSLRIATMAETSPEVVKDVEAVMRRKLSNVISQDYAAAGGARPLAEILNHADLTTERNVIDSIAAADPELGEEIRMLLFTFEDIVRLDDRSVQLILKEINQKDLVLALRGAPEEVKQKILTNMSSRGADMLLEEMEYQEPQRRSVIEGAQSNIVSAIRSLEEKGILTIGRDADDDQVI